MSKAKLLEQALIDAKAVREVALKNAKLSLEESFMPRIKSTFASMVEHELDENEDLDEYRELVGGEGDEEIGQLTQPIGDEEDSIEDEVDIDLDELLAEIELDEATEDEEELDESVEDELDEAKKKDKEGEDKKSPKKPKADKSEDDEEIGKMSKEDLIDLIHSVVAEMQGEGHGEPDGDELGGEMGDDLGMGAEDLGDEGLDEEIDLDSLFEGEDEEEETDTINEVKRKKVVKENLKREKALIQTLNETNLLNAKLIYVNKILKEHNLSNATKMKLIDAFDEAKTIKEAKLVYTSWLTSLKESKQTPKRMIRENLGIASKTVGTFKKDKNIINENTQFVSRFQKLANIKK